MISVGTLKAASSARKSVVVNDLAQARVASRLACMPTLRTHSSSSWLTGCATGVTLKNFSKKPARNFGRSSRMACAVWSNAVCSAPSGLSPVFSQRVVIKTAPRLRGAAKAAAVVGNGPVARVGKCHCLIVPAVRRERPAMNQDHGLPRAPILDIKLGVVGSDDLGHRVLLLLGVGGFSSC